MYITKTNLKWKAVWLCAALAFFGLEGKAQVTEVTLENISEDTYEINTPGDYKITGTGSVDHPTGKNIKVNVEGTVNVTIKNVHISADGSNGAPFDITRGTVNLTLEGESSLIATGNNKAGLRVPQNTSLVITEASNGGSLTAQGSPYRGGAGIGSNFNEQGESITINGGTILAKHGDCAAGIGGGGYYGAASSITINGGYVTAITHHAAGDPAAIGGGGNGDGGVITITGGTVITLFELENYTRYEIGAIGHGANKSTTSVTITGGSVYYDPSIRSVTPTNGSTNLVKKAISDLTPNAKITSLSEAEGYGIKDMYVDEKGMVYLWLPNDANPIVTGLGEQVTINFTVNKDGSSWNDHNKTFTLKKENMGDEISGIENVFYLENGSHTVYADRVETNQTITVSGAGSHMVTIDYYTVTYNPNNETAVTVKAYPAGATITPESELTPTRNYYTFKGWSSTTEVIEKVETITNIGEAKTLYAIWEPVAFTIKKIDEQQLTYGADYSYEFKASDLSDDISNANGLKSITVKENSSLPDGLKVNGTTISGKPATADETGQKVTFTVTANNGASQDIEVTFKVQKAELTVKPNPDQSIYEDEAPLYTVEGAVGGETPEFTGALTVEGGYVTEGDLALKSEFATNYLLTVEESVSINILSGNASSVVATIESASSSGDWNTGDVTLLPPIGFKIALIKSELKTIPVYDNQLVWSQDGSYELTYSLQRQFAGNKTFEYTADVKLDKTAPTLTASVNDLNYTLSFSDGNGSGIAKLLIDRAEQPLSPGAQTFSGKGSAGTYRAKVIDQAGHETEVSFTLKNTYVPPYIPPVTPICYDVTLPAVDGVTTDPVAGSYEVESWSSFSFTLTVDEGYRENSQPVVKANGIVVTPSTSDGKYIVRSITRDTEITIEGIAGDTPTANEVIDTGLHIRRSEHALHITTPKAVRIRLVDFAGRIIRNTLLSPGDNHLYNITAGSYILLPEGGEGIKVIVN